MGRRRLRADARIVPARLRLAGGSPRAAADLRGWLRGVHGRLAPLRPGPRRHRAELLPRPPGSGSRGDVRHGPRPDRTGVRGPRARSRDRPLGCDRRRRRRRGAADRRPAHRRTGLGVDLLRERPDRDCRDRADGDAACERRGDRPAANRLGRAGDVLACPLRIHLRLDPRQRGGLGLGSDPDLADRSARADGRVRGDPSAQQARDARALALPRSFIRRSFDCGLGPLRRHVRDVPLPHALHPGRPRVFAARGRGALPADHPALVLGGSARGQPLEPHPGPRPHGHRARARRRRPLTHARDRGGRRVDRAPAGVRGGRDRYRDDQSDDRRDGACSGARGASGNGFRHQLDVPPGWDRDRCRGSRGRLPVADHDQAVGTRPASSARGGGGGLVRGDRPSRGGRPSAASSPGG